MKTTTERNPFFIYTQDGFVTIYLGDKESLESEFILCIDKTWLKSLIAALRMAEEMEC